MSDMEPNKLDDLLRDWASHTTPDADQLSTLQNQILNDWEAEQQIVTRASAIKQQPQASRSALAVGIAVGALVTALAVLLWNASTNDATHDVIADRRDQPPPEFAWLSDAQLADKVILRDEMLAMFDQKFGWIAETGDNLEVGIDGRLNSLDSPSVAVRLIVERRALASSEWTTVWAVDVVALSEERVEITPQSRGLSDVRLWAYALPDGMVSLDTELSIKGFPQIVSESLQSGGKPVVIFQTQSDQDEIRVLQAAAVL